MYPPPSSLTIPKGSRISQKMGHLLGEGRIRAHKNQVSPPKKSPGNCLVIIFPKIAWTPPPKWPSQISFLSPNTLVNLCTKQSLPPTYFRLLWVRAPSSPSQGGDQAPSSTLLGGFLLTWALSSPAVVRYLLTWKVQAVRNRILPEGRGPSPPQNIQATRPRSSPKWDLSPQSEVSLPMHQML